MDATEKAGIGTALNRCRALATKIANELRNKRPEHFVDRWQTFTQRARRPRHRRAHATGRLHVRRAKDGSPSVHPMQGDEIRALRRLQREQGLSSHIFMTERDGPMKKAPQRVRIPALLISGDATSPQCEVGSRAYQLLYKPVNAEKFLSALVASVCRDA